MIYGRTKYLLGENIFKIEMYYSYSNKDHIFIITEIENTVNTRIGLWNMSVGW